MAEDTRTQIGDLDVQIARDKKELKALEQEADVIANQLHLVAHCLDTRARWAKISGFRGDREFVLDREPSSMYEVESKMSTSEGYVYEIPSDKDVARVMKRAYELEKQIEDNEEKRKDLVNREIG